MTSGTEHWKDEDTALDRVWSVGVTLSRPRSANWIAEEAEVPEWTARRLTWAARRLRRPAWLTRTSLRSAATTGCARTLCSASSVHSRSRRSARGGVRTSVSPLASLAPFPALRSLRSRRTYGFSRNSRHFSMRTAHPRFAVAVRSARGGVRTLDLRMSQERGSTGPARGFRAEALMPYECGAMTI